MVVSVALGVVVVALARAASGVPAAGVRERLRRGGDLAAVLDRSVAAGLLTADQADTDLVAERSRQEPQRPPGSGGRRQPGHA